MPNNDKYYIQPREGTNTFRLRPDKQTSRKGPFVSDYF